MRRSLCSLYFNHSYDLKSCKYKNFLILSFLLFVCFLLLSFKNDYHQMRLNNNYHFIIII